MPGRSWIVHRSRVGVVVALSLVAIVTSPTSAGASDLREDIVGGSCSALVSHVATPGVRGFDGGLVPGRWGVTQPIVFIGKRRIDDPLVGDQVNIHVDPDPTGSGGVCLVARATFAFRTETHISVIEWKSTAKPASACDNQWKRVRAQIRAHEEKHVKDIDDTIAEENKRVPTLPPVKACGATRDVAVKKAGLGVLAMLQAEVAAVGRTLEAKAAKRDVETATMDCKPCVAKVSFNDADISCTIRTPKCSLRTGQKIDGEVCGDPLTATWKITPRYYSEGCGMSFTTPASSSKPFSNDCVAAGSADEKSRIEAYRKRPAGAGGWMCVYRDTPKPQVTIRWFQMAQCDGKAEQSITVDARTADSCDEPPPPSPPVKPRPVP